MGSHLVERLVEMGDEVTVLDDFSAGKLSNLEAVKCKIVEGSVCNLPLVRNLTAKTDVTFHLATRCLVQGLEDPKIMHQVNDIGTYNVCLASKEYNTKIVYINSSEAYGIQNDFPIKETAPMNPVSIYGLTKHIGELYVNFFHKTYGTPVVSIRPFNFFGPRHREDSYAAVITNFIKRIEANERPIIYGNGLQTRDFSYVSDVVDGILLLSKLENGEIINLGGGGEVSILELANLVVQAWTENDDLEAEVIFEEARPNDIRRLCPDISLAESYGYKPKIPLKTGLAKYISWYRRKKK